MGEEMQYTKTHVFEWQKDKIKELLIELEAARNANLYLRECHSDWSTKAIEWKEKSELLQLEIYELESKLALQNILMFDIPEWISVDDRLPQCYQRVLCHRPDKFSVICKFVQGCVYHFTNAETGFTEDEVTHWQPLPELPKELNK